MPRDVDLEAFIKHVPGNIYAITDDGTIILSNDEQAKLFIGKDGKDLEGTSIADLFNQGFVKADAGEIFDHHKALNRYGDQDVFEEHLIINGEHRTYLSKKKYFEHKGKKTTIGVALDVTDYKVRLRQAEQDLEKAHDNQVAMIATIDNNLRSQFQSISMLNGLIESLGLTDKQRAYLEKERAIIADTLLTMKYASDSGKITAKKLTLTAIATEVFHLLEAEIDRAHLTQPAIIKGTKKAHHARVMADGNYLPQVFQAILNAANERATDRIIITFKMKKTQLEMVFSYEVDELNAMYLQKVDQEASFDSTLWQDSVREHYNEVAIRHMGGNYESLLDDTVRHVIIKLPLANEDKEVT